jgi:uncharacterized protein
LIILDSFMVITGFFAALLGLFYVFLSINVIKARRKYAVILGDNNQYELQRHIRGHANFNEYTPFFLILFGLLEYMQLPNYALIPLGGIFLIARISHAYGVMFAEKIVNDKATHIKFRVMGMMGTFNCIIIASVCLIILSVLKMI